MTNRREELNQTLDAAGKLLEAVQEAHKSVLWASLPDPDTREKDPGMRPSNATEALHLVTEVRREVAPKGPKAKQGFTARFLRKLTGMFGRAEETEH